MLCFSSIVAQLVENVPIELGMTFPSLCGDEIAVHHALLVDPLGAGLFDLEADVAVAGQLAAPGDAGGDQDLYAVADGEDPFALLVKIPDELQQLAIVPEKLRRAASNQQHGVVAGGLRLAKCDVGFDQVTGALDVSIPTGLEVVNDSVEPFLFRGTDMRHPTLLLEPMFRVQNLVGLPGIISHYQDFINCLLHLNIVI